MTLADYIRENNVTEFGVFAIKHNRGETAILLDFDMSTGEVAIELFGNERVFTVAEIDATFSEITSIRLLM